MFRAIIGALQRPRLGPVLVTALHLAALAVFIHGFLLTRVHLAERSTAVPSAAAGGGAGAANGTAAAPYNKVVWLMIDALRYDFVVTDGRYTCTQQEKCHQGHMPFLSELGRHQDAARSFMFVSDAPTTTTQRLKSLTTGGLPSFFDVSNSFTAGAVADDNLVDQLAAAGWKLAFLGDTTWQQLFPRQWAWSHPFPCFNVKDLHSVDDGVAAHLAPALRQPGGWDLLVAHYLGVDHCGHTFGVDSVEMALKLRQMDDQVREVVEAMVEDAGPGGPYERALLLVSGDHGQTLGGDHGGGSPEEVDSALVAVDLKALYHSRKAAASADKSSGSVATDNSDGALAGTGADAQPGREAAGGGLPAPAACRTNCSCGVEGNQCAPDLLQIDLTPTLAAMLGVPIPFGNMGKLSAELWQLTAAHMGTAGSSSASAGTAAAWERSLAGVLLANAQQVHMYLNTYAATPGTTFSRAALSNLNALFKSLAPSAAPADGDGAVAPQISRCNAYLEAAAEVAREQWTQFGEAPMLLGLALFAASLLLQAAAAFGGNSSGSRGSIKSQGRASGSTEAAAAWSSRPAALGRLLRGWQLVAPWRPGHWLPVPTFRGWLAAMALLHGLGIFSFFYLLSEGTRVCFLVAAACAGLALATGRATRAAGKPVRGVVGLGVMSLRCNALMALMGVAHHTGQGFWARLTVHDPQPADDVERGLKGKLGKMRAFGAMLMARAGLDQLPPAVLSVAQHSALCTLPILALALLTERLQRGGAAGGGRSRLQRLLQLAAFLSVAAYQQLEQAGRQALLPADISLQQLVGQHAWPLLPSSLAGRLQQLSDAAVQPVLLAWPAAAQYGRQLLAIPLRELLPHATYAISGMLAVAWLLQAATRRLRGAAAATAAAQLVLALVLQVSDRQAPLILLLGLLELVAITKLMGRRAELLAGSATPPPPAAAVSAEAAALVTLVQAQLFYVTGHLCEFAGLQYTAGFVGSDEFHLWRSGALLALNTFGAMLLALLGLPAILQHVQHAAAAGAAASSSASGSSGASNAASAAAKQKSTDPASTHSGATAALASSGASVRSLLVAGLVRALTAFCAMLSAGVQRRHLYSWALFAPKFAFEACFLLLTDLVLVLLGAVLA